MPIQHMVWIRFKPGITAARIEQHLAGLRGLTGRVPGVISLAVGPNLTDRAQGYTHGLLVTLTDRAALEAYGPHPEHMKVAAPLRDDADLMAMDIEG